MKVKTILTLFLLFSLVIAEVAVDEPKEVNGKSEQEEENEFFGESSEAVPTVQLKDPKVISARERFLPQVPSAVHTYDIAEYEQFLTNHTASVVIFVETLLEKTQHAAKNFELIAQDLKKQNITTLVVDCSANGNFHFMYEIAATPLIRYYLGDKIMKDYSFRDYELDSLKAFVESFHVPIIVEAKNIEDVETLREKYPVILGVFPTRDDFEFKEFNKTAHDMDRILERFVYIIEPEREKHDKIVRKYLDSELSNVIVIPRKKDTECAPAAFDSEITVDPPQLFKLITEVRLPLFGEIAEELYNEYYEQEKTEAWFLMTPELHEKYKADIVRVFKPLRNKFVFFWLDKDRFPEQAKAMYFSSKRLPALCIAEHGDHKEQFFFGEDEEFTIPGMEKFVQQYLNHELKPYVLSETLTDDEMKYEEGKIGKISAKNFGVVNDTQFKHVVLYTSDNCDDCKEYEQKFKEYVNKHRDELHGFRFYTLETTKNYVPDDVPVGSAFPILGVFQGKKAFYFTGLWSDENLTAFIHTPNEETSKAGEEAREEARLAKMAAEDPQRKELFDQINSMMKTEPILNAGSKSPATGEQKASSAEKSSEKKEL